MRLQWWIVILICLCTAASWEVISETRQTRNHKSSAAFTFAGINFSPTATSTAFAATKRVSRNSHDRQGEQQACNGMALAAGARAEDEGQRGPLIVTIGPQCAGKTTALRELRHPAGGVMDVAIDSFPTVYQKFPREQVMGGIFSDVADGKTHLLRGSGAVEAKIVANVLSGSCSLQEAGKELTDVYRREWRSEDVSIVNCLFEVLQRAIATGVTMESATIDVFDRTAIPEGVEASIRRLKLCLERYEGPVAWGNTNTAVKDIRDALALAADCHRPVRFLSWGGSLPRLHFTELLSRNVERFALTGRYIPAGAISLSCRRVEELASLTQDLQPACIAYAAGFAMDERGYVRRRVSDGFSSRRSGDLQDRDGKYEKPHGGRGRPARRQAIDNSRQKDRSSPRSTREWGGSDTSGSSISKMANPSYTHTWNLSYGPSGAVALTSRVQELDFLRTAADGVGLDMIGVASDTLRFLLDQVMQMGNEWKKIKIWRKTKWEKYEFEKVTVFFTPPNNGTENEPPPKRSAVDRLPDTLDVVKSIKDWNKRK